MPRFYISDGNRPGRRTPYTEYATRANGVGSEVMNEPQAVQRGRILQPDAVNSARFVRIAFNTFTGASRDDINPFRIRIRTSAGVNVSQGRAANLYGANVYDGNVRYEATDDNVANAAYGSNFWYPADASAGRHLIVDLGAIYSVHRIEMGSWSDGGIDRFIEVAFSTDGSAYDIVAPAYAHSGSGIKTIYQYAAASAGGGPVVLLTPTNLSADDGAVIRGSQYSPGVGAAYNVFDGNDATTWFPYGGVDDTWIGYDCGLTPKRVTRYRLVTAGSHWGGVATVLLQSSPDLTNWTTVDTATDIVLGVNDKTGWPDAAPARYWRVKRTTGSPTNLANTEVGSLELYGN